MVIIQKDIRELQEGKGDTVPTGRDGMEAVEAEEVCEEVIRRLEQLHAAVADQGAEVETRIKVGLKAIPVFCTAELVVMEPVVDLETEVAVVVVVVVDPLTPVLW